MGIKGDNRVTLKSGGDRAWDTLQPCGPGQLRDYTHLLCYDPLTGNIQAAVAEAPAGGEETYRTVDLGALAAQAVSQTQPGGMQLNVQPNKEWVYSGVPTIVYMTGEAPTSSQVVDGFNVTVTWRVREHRFEFNDPNGSDSTLTTSENGLPYPNETITWNYAGEGNTSIRVTTTWDADVSVAGVTFSLNNQHTTQSESRTFEVRKPIFSLTKTPGT
ncbi:MAG: hypothetical protein Q4E01_02880 [Actinomycetaceae bacterium]|nr:hypothetical protein [Actinomycetaceae bacterium]